MGTLRLAPNGGMNSVGAMYPIGQRVPARALVEVPPPPLLATVIAAVPVQASFALTPVLKVRPEMVRLVVAVVRPMFDRGWIVMIASSMPSLFSSTGSLAIVARGRPPR